MAHAQERIALEPGLIRDGVLAGHQSQDRAAAGAFKKKLSEGLAVYVHDRECRVTLSAYLAKLRAVQEHDHANALLPPDPPTAEARLDAMREWATKVEAQLKALSSGSEMLGGHITHLAEVQTELEQKLSNQAATQQQSTGDCSLPYQPTPQQFAALYQALAEWQVKARPLTKGSKASIQTRSGGTVEYRYSDIAAVSEIARSAGEVGLAHFHRQITLDGRAHMRTYLVHQSGGWISADVPLLTRENAMISGLQQWASACTMARRYGLFMVLGIAAGDEDDDGAMSDAPSPAGNVPPRRPGATMNRAVG